FLLLWRPPSSRLFPYTTLFRSHVLRVGLADFAGALDSLGVCQELTAIAEACLRQALAIVDAGSSGLAVLALGKLGGRELGYAAEDRKSTRLNSSHVATSYAGLC